MSNKKVWSRAKQLLQTMIDDRIEIYEVTRILNPMSNESRKKLSLCRTDITDEDLDQIEETIKRYKETLIDMSSTVVTQRVKRSEFFKKLEQHYDKNKNKKSVRKRN
jgi:hypothetical protein